MSTESKVGAFVIASILVLAAALYYVRTTQTVQGQVEYRTYFSYAGGLAPGASVLFGGIKVGQVTAVQPWSGDPTRIEIKFQVKRGTPVNAQSTARVGSVSLMSSPVLSLSTGSQNAPRLKAGSVVPSEETVRMEEVLRRISELAESVNGLVAELRTEIPALTSEAKQLLANLNQISGKKNQQNIEQILTELNTMTRRESAKIAEITQRISALAKHADEVVVAAEPLVKNMDKTVTNMNETVHIIRDQLEADLVELEATIQQAGTLLGSVQKVIQTNDTEIAEMVRNLRAASENVQALTESLTQRPWSLLRITQPEDREVPK